MEKDKARRCVCGARLYDPETELCEECEEENQQRG